MKLITPIIYVAFLIPMTGIAVGIEAVARTIGILGEYKGLIDLPIFIVFFYSIIAVGIPLFWLTNLLIQKLEKLINPSTLDHLRQSLFFYLIVIYSLVSWIARGAGNNEEDGYLLMWIGISIVAIVMNYLFLFRRRKASLPNTE